MNTILNPHTDMMRRRKYPTSWMAAVLVAILITADVSSAEPIEIGNRLELFVDDHLIDKIDGDVRQQLLKPEPKEVVFVADEPWEGNTSGYYTFFQDGDLYRMIYRGWQHDEQKKAAHKEVTCYAESKDGIHWTKPKLGLFEWNGSKENNIVWLGPGTHNFTAFRDDNPATRSRVAIQGVRRPERWWPGAVQFARLHELEADRETNR